MRAAAGTSGTSGWATSSDPSTVKRPILLLLSILVAAGSPAAAGVLLTVDEALGLAFPDCEVERETVFLTEEQEGAVAAEAGTELASRIVHPYRARCDAGSGGPESGGVAYFDAHRVRTLPETLMVVVGSDGRVRRVELLSFDEPMEYVPRDAWYAQFLEQELDAELDLDREIRPVTGATLTAVATTEAVRRILALHRLLEDGEEAP